jgi:hypothetical protein
MFTVVSTLLLDVTSSLHTSKWEGSERPTVTHLVLRSLNFTSEDVTSAILKATDSEDDSDVFLGAPQGKQRLLEVTWRLLHVGKETGTKADSKGELNKEHIKPYRRLLKQVFADRAEIVNAIDSQNVWGPNVSNEKRRMWEKEYKGKT